MPDLPDLPDLPDRWAEALLIEARQRVPAHVLRYLEAGAREEITTGEAPAAWRAIRLWPRVLHDVRRPDTSARILGERLGRPFGVAPTSLRSVVRADGEVEMARGVAAADGLLVVSSNAGAPFAAVAATGVRWWLQAYLTADRALIAPALEAAAAAGARAVVLTVDTPRPGPKWDIDDAAFGDLRDVYGVNHPEAVRGRTPGAEHAQDLGPADIAWLTRLLDLPVVVKGVLRPDDAVRCLDAGAAAVWVSNHGGRQLDRSVATATALPLVREAVGPDASVYVDGGITSGVDVLTALALGADVAFLGRLPLWGLGARGAPGVGAVLSRLAEELEDALRLAGCPDLDACTELIRPQPADLRR